MNIKKLHPELGSQNRSFSLSNPSRLWFTSLGCKQVPPDIIGGKILWAHPEGYFLNAHGQKLCPTFNPSMNAGIRDAKGCKIGSCYPIMRRYRSKLCHFLMALAFYGERPTYKDKNGKPYVGICHHIIPDKLDYRPANLLCWLTREQHVIADRRQSALSKLVPDLHAFPIERLRILEDPRVTTDEQFEFELAQLQPGFILVDPAILDDLELTKHYDPFIERD